MIAKLAHHSLSSPFRKSILREWQLASALLFSALISAHAGLVINEIFNAANANDEYVEFLVTSNMTLQDLDSIWFGDSNTFSTGVASENSFNATGIISNSSYFNSTTDVIAAGTIITVGGSNISTDFNYNPDPADPSDTDAWNLTFTVGNGVDGVTGNTPFNLGSFGDSVWVSSSQPTAGAGYNDLISGVGYGWFAGPLGNAILTRQGLGEEGFQMLSPFTGDWDGVLTNGSALSNQDPNGFDFANSEAPGGTMGTVNGAANEAYAYDLRAVPEPSAIIPMILILGAAGFFVLKKGQKETVVVS
jgi:hypothetical protein